MTRPLHRLAYCMGAIVLAAVPSAVQDYEPNQLATFSIIARDSATGGLGYAVQSKAFAAGNRAVHIKPDSASLLTRRRRP